MWESFQNTDLDWKELLNLDETTSYFHDAEWGTHLQNSGWSQFRWVYKEDVATSLLQGFVKFYPLKVGILWFPDWIAGNIKMSKNLQLFLMKDLDLNYIYIRFRSNAIHSDEDIRFLEDHDWSRPSYEFGNRLGVEMIIKSQEEFKLSLKRNWRRALNKSNQVNYQIDRIFDHQIIVALNNELRELKSLKKHNIFDASEVQSIVESFKEQIIILGIKDDDNSYLALRGAIIYQNKAYDIFAATGKIARNLSLSHALFAALVEECRKKGCVKYDLGGIDPINGPGVYNFKMGTGASKTRLIGEFEWSNNRLLSLLINFFSRYR